MRLPFFRFRASRRPPSPPPPQPHELIAVVGVGVTQNAGGLALTLLSLEQYREGTIVLFRLLRPRGRFEREYPHPRLRLTVVPEGPVP